MPTIFDELLALLTPARVLHDDRATGAGVRVAVLDSGVERAVLEEKHPSSPRIEGGIFLCDRPEPLPYEGRQSTPHGTTVADIVNLAAITAVVGNGLLGEPVEAAREVVGV